jgi:hypothetical protein
VFDTQPFDPKFNPEEAERLSRRDYAERNTQQPRRTQSMRATPSEQIERTTGQAIADTGIGLLQGAAAIPKGIASNINAGDNPVAKFYESAIQAGERSKSPYLQSQKAEREALLKNVLQNQGELAQTRAVFTSMFSPAGADVVSQGAGSMLPVVGMSLLNLGQKSFVATNALANAGEAAQNTARELSQMSPQDWSKSNIYQELRAKGLSHADSVRMLAPLMAMPTQLLGGIVGGVSGSTGLEKSLAGKAITGGVRERAARAGAELLGEEAETLAPSLAGNITQRLIDEKKSITEGLGREAVETAFGATPGMALAASGRSESNAPKELDTRGLAERMARERGFLKPEASPERPATTQERIEPTLDPWAVEEETPITPAVDKRQALKDAIAKRVKPADTEVTPEVQSAPSATPEQIKEAAAVLERRGVDPVAALRIATVRLGGTTEVQPDAQTTVDQEGTENVAEPISGTSGVSTTVPAQPTVDVPTTERSEGTERDGVVSTRQDAGEPADREGTQPSAVTVDVPDTLEYFEKRDALIKQLDEASEESSALLDKMIDLDSVRAASVLGADGKPLVLDENGRYDSDRKYEARKTLEAERDKASAKFDAVIKQLDELDAARAAARAAKTKSVEKTEAERIKAEDEKNAAYEAKKAKAQSIARSNASAAFDQVNEDDYGGDIEAALDAYRTNMADTLDEEGLRNDPDYNSIFAAAERAFEAEVTKLKGTTTDGTKTTETVQAKEEGQEAPAAGAVTGKTRGRPKAELTEEQRAEKETTRKEGRNEYMRGERALPKLQAKLDEAAAPVDETNIADDEGLTAAQNEKRVLKRDTINAMLDLEAKHRGTALGKRVKAALADRSKISQKDYDDVVAGRKYKAQERVNKSSASVDEVEGADEGFSKATTASQALNQVIKTGTAFQKLLAKRLRGLVRDVKFVVVEETDPLPEQLSRHQDAWGSDNARARGVYFENTATDEKIIFVRGASAGGFQGINNTTVLHEALHAATQQKLELALTAVKRGFSTDAKLTRAYNDLIAVMNNAKDEYNRLSNLGQLPTDIYYLKTVSGVFSNPHEFVSYGMTDPFFQKFLMGAYGTKEETSFFTRFVDAIREMLGMGLDTVNALSDLIAVTDEILSAKLTPTMRMLDKADKANAKREARVSKVYAQTPKMPEETTAVIQETQADIEDRVQYHLEQIQKSKDAEEIAKQASMLHALRDPKKILPALNRLWKYMSYKQKQVVLVPLHIDAAASWGASYVPELANTNVLMQRLAGMTEVLLEAAADVSTDAMRVFSKNPGEQTKIQDVALASTLARIDPSDKTATKRSAKLDKMYNDLTPDGKRVYNQMRDHLNDMTDYYMFLLEESINAENIPADGKALIMARIKQIYEASKKITPYFALTREGPYWLSIGKGEKREFYMRPSMTERDALAEELAAERGVPVSDFLTGNNISEMRKNTYLKSDLLKDVFTAIDAVKDTDPNAKENLKDSVYELYIRTMPESSFRGQFAERKNITGFSTDVLRGFNETSVKMAVQLARLKYSPQLRMSISAARDSAKGRPDVEPFVDDMERRVMSMLNPRERGGFDTFATIMNRLSAITYLSGPSTALIQPISIMQTGYVILGARHGYGKAAAELGKMSKFWDEYAVTKKRLDGSTMWVMPTIENSKSINLNDEEKWAVKQMRLRAVTSSTYASELLEFKSKSTEEVMSKTEKAKVAAQAMTFGLLHSADRLAREVVWLASYRLNRINGKTPEQSVDQAVADTNESQGNFAEYAKSELMKAPGGRLALQFTTYALNITTLLIRNFYRMIPGLNAEGKAEAFKIFFGTLSSTSLIAGITGLPMYSVVMALLSFAWEEKERPQELKDLSRDKWFTEVYLPETLGSITLGGYKLSALSDIAATGVLNKLTGLDFASRTGLNDMWFREGKETKTSRESVVAAAVERAGPAASMVLSWVDAYDAFSQGDTQKGLEKVAPAIARNILIANKYATEGAKDNKGNVIAKPEAFNKWDLYGQALGFRSAPLANVQAVNFKLTAIEKRIDNERTQLLNNLDRAYRKKDLKEYAKISNDINKRFNVMYPYAAIDEIDKSLETREEARGKSWRGVEVDEKNSRYAYEAAKKSRAAMKEKEEAK